MSVSSEAAVEGARIVVANTFSYAGIMRVAGRARCNSGHLDVAVEVDGECYGTTPIDITLQPAAVPLLAPR